MSTTRRQLIGRGLGAAGAAAVPASLLTATPAFAQESDETDALERIVILEQAAELAYSLAAEDGKVGSDAKQSFELFSTHCGDHDTALSEALDQLGVDPPEAESDPADYERLADFDPKASEKELLDFTIKLEEELVAVYADETETLEEEDLVRTAAQVGAAHAQMLVALRVLAGEKPVALLPRP
jgi:rubrerythrin